MIKELKIRNFKGIRDANFVFAPTINIICGNNATGKTTCLDAIQYSFLLRTTSYRKGIELINDLSDEATIELSFLTKKGEKTRMVLISKYGQKMGIDGEEIKRTSDFITGTSIVSFSSDDVNSIIGSPVLRRKMLNIIACQLDHEYLILLNQYSKILKEKKKLLNDDFKIDLFLFETLCEKQFSILVEVENKITQFVNKLNIKIKKFYSLICGQKETASIKLKPNFNVNNGLDEFLKNCNKEIQYRTVLFGCQRDDYIFSIDDDAIIGRASQGQIKSLVLAFKLSCIELLKENTGNDPIVLLDDVFGELDKERQNFLLDFLTEQKNQIFITTPSIADIYPRFIDSANIIYLEKGGVYRGHEGS